MVLPPILANILKTFITGMSIPAEVNWRKPAK